MKVGHKTKQQQLQDIINDYREEHPGENFRMSMVALWALSKGRWGMPKKTAIQICAEELSAAARQEFFEDDKGRTIRRKHVVRRVTEDHQMVFEWADIDDATPEHMRLSLSQRRQGVLGDVKQLKNDQDYYNEKNPHGAEIQLNFNFQEDLDELNQPTEYPEGPPEEE